MERPWFKRNRTSFQIIIRVTAFWVVPAMLLRASLSHATIPGRKGSIRRICSGHSRQRLLPTQLTVGIGRNSFRIRRNPSRGLSAISGLPSAATQERDSFGSSGLGFTKYSEVIRRECCRESGLNCEKSDAGRTAFNLGEVAGPEHSGVAVRRGQS